MHILGIPWDFAAILLALAVFIPWRGAVRIRRLLSRPNLGTRERLALYASTIAFQWIATGVILWRAAARGLTALQLGLVVGNSSRTIAVAVGTTACLTIVQWQALRQLRRGNGILDARQQQFREKILPQNLTESLVFFALACTVAVCEELIYRGFAFAAFSLVSGGSATIAILASSAIFSAAHAYQGRKGVVMTFILGALFALTRAWTLSLLPAMLAHLIFDLISGLSGVGALRTGSPGTPAPDGPAAGGFAVVI
jgi:membrane protease YdiL (CAAX protease family)